MTTDTSPIDPSPPSSARQRPPLLRPFDHVQPCPGHGEGDERRGRPVAAGIERERCPSILKPACAKFGQWIGRLSSEHYARLAIVGPVVLIQSGDSDDRR